MEYAAFPTTTHFVERSVKVYNFCSNKSRKESRISEFAICYNIVHDVNNLTKELMIEEKRVRGGLYKNETKVKAVGKMKNRTILQNVIKRNDDIVHALKGNNELNSIYEDIKAAVSYDDKASFKSERHRDYHEKNKCLRKKDRRPNKLERAKGVEHTAAVKREVKFFDVKKEFGKDGIKAELEARGFSDFSIVADNITALKDKLKEIIVERGEVQPDKKDGKVRNFPIKSNYNWSMVLSKEKNE